MGFIIGLGIILLGIIILVVILKKKGVFLGQILPADGAIYDIPRKKIK